jgi:hypothetical protein
MAHLLIWVGPLRRGGADSDRSRQPHLTPGEHLGGSGSTTGHYRVRLDRIDTSGVITLRHNSRLHHIGLGRRPAGTRVLILAHDLDIRVLTTNGELRGTLRRGRVREAPPILVRVPPRAERDRRVSSRAQRPELAPGSRNRAPIPGLNNV